MLTSAPSPMIIDVPSSPFSARSSSVDLLPAKLYTIDEIGLYDVLCGRDKAAFNNIGNRRFRVTVSLSLDRYLQAATRKEKSVVIKSVVTMLHADGGKFLQQLVSTKRSNSDSNSDAPLYIELNEKQAHEKAGHALRDMALLRSKTSSSNSTKKNKAVDQPLIDGTNTTVTLATSILSSLMSSSNKKIKCSQHEIFSTIAHEHEALLPRQLDSWTELTWDESSELTLDESTFDILVQSVVANSNGDSTPCLASEETNPTGMTIAHNSTTEQSPMDVVPFDNIQVPVNEGTMDVDRISSTVSEMMNHKSTSKDTERTSSASFTLDDEMVSWLVGESDFVLQV